MKIKFNHIQDLSDARYAAAAMAEWIGFTVGDLPLSQVQEIIGWCAGPKLTLELPNRDLKAMAISIKQHKTGRLEVIWLHIQASMYGVMKITNIRRIQRVAALILAILPAQPQYGMVAAQPAHRNRYRYRKNSNSPGRSTIYIGRYHQKLQPRCHFSEL